MIINSVKACGFERIHEWYKECIQSGRNTFEASFMNYLHHSMISIDLDDISTMELYFLKSFSSMVHVVNYKYQNFINSKDKETYTKVDELLKLQTAISEDSDIDKYAEPENILPIGCKRYHVVVTFTGPSITNITTIRVESLFVEDSKFNPDYPGNAIVEEKLAGMFYNSFYKHMSDSMTGIDIVTDFMTNKKFYQYSEDGVSLATINSPYGEINFFGSDSDKLNQQIAHIKKNQNKLATNLLDCISLTFVVKSTFNTFFNMYLNYRKNVLDHTNFRLVFADPNVSVDPDIFQKYQVRLNEGFDYMGKFKKQLSSNPEIDLNVFNYISFGNMMDYSLKFTLKELDEPLPVYNINEMNVILKKIKALGETSKKIIY